MLLAVKVKEDVLTHNYNDFTNAEVSRETNFSTLWNIGNDLLEKSDGMDMCVSTRFTVAEEEDFLVMYHYENTDSLVLLRGYVLKAE